MLKIDSLNNFVNNLYCEDGSFRFSLSSLPGVYPTCFAVLALSLTNKLKEYSENDRKKIALFIKKHQNEDSGIFEDAKIKKNHGDFHGQEYINFQLTDFAILALEELSERPEFPLKFIEKYKNEIYLKKWLKNSDWSDPWKVSNLIMFLLNFLLFENKSENEKYVDFIISWLDENQDARNGFWNMGNRTDFINQLAGAYHFLFFYTYLQKSPKYLKKMVDSILKIQNYDGLFTYWGGGGSCEDLDAIDILCRSTFYSDYRKMDIKMSLEKSYHLLLKNQNKDGGFCWAKRNKFSWKKIRHIVEWKLVGLSRRDFIKNALEKTINQLMVIIYPSRLWWKYSGIESMKVRYDESDMWSTWFRLLAIAFIEETFPEIVNNKKTLAWNMRKKPGLGFYK